MESKMTSQELRKLLDEYYKKQLDEDPFDTDLIMRKVGFRDAVELLWPLVEALEKLSEKGNTVLVKSIARQTLADLKEKLKGG